MFRIQENVDGTTSIYCKNSGNLLCTVPSKANSSIHQRINVVEPQPSNPKWQHLNYSTTEEPTNLQNDEKDDTPLTRASLCCLSAIPISLDGDQSEDYSGDCVSQECFAKCLGLVSRHTLSSNPRDKLLAEWPLRLLSRSKAYRTSEPSPKDVKIPDQLPLTSCLGVRLLRQNEARVFASADRVKAQLRSYESFCRHPWNAACPTSCHFPKLRCREKKTYPVVTGGRVLRHTPHTHTYTRGRRQRMERKCTRRTGLDARSRRLLRICSRRPLSVDVARLPESEIRDWLSRRDAPSDRSESSSEEDQDPSYRPSMRPMAGLRSRRDTRTVNQWRCSSRMATPTNTVRCSVYVRNIVMDIQRLRGTHYVKNTNIKVPFFRDFLGSLRTNQPLLNAVYVANGIEPKKFLSKTMEDVSFLPSIKTQNVCSSRTLPSRGSQNNKFVLCTKDSSGLKEVFGETWQRPGEPFNDAVQKTKKALMSSAGGHSSGFKEFLPLEGVNKVCPKRKPAKTLSVAQKDSSNHKAPLRAAASANKFKQKTKKPLVLNLDKHSLGAVQEGFLTKQSKAKTKKSKPVVLNLETHSSALKVLLQSPGTSKGSQKNAPNPSEPIPVIDLTQETTPPKKTVANRPQETLVPRSESGQKRPLFAVQNQAKGVVQERFLVSQWKFRCFACGFQRLFFDREQPHVVEKAVRDHMHSYHYVSDAESFLSRYLDSVNHCTVIEAFPGFKGSDD